MISSDTCRLWDSKTEKKLDKDRFRKLRQHNSSLSRSSKKIRIMPEETNISEVNFGKTIPINLKIN